MKISVITPSIREEGLEMVYKSLKRQVFTDWEWIVVSPFEYTKAIWLKDDFLRDGYTYSLNRCWNRAFREAKGELVVSIVDMQWFPPDTLEKLWIHYELSPMSCIGGVGHQYSQVENGKPEHRIWFDPRMREDEQFYEIPPIDFELCIASLPLKGIKEVGGVDEFFDFFAALSEKELCSRMAKLGYRFFLDQSIEYRALQHDRVGGREEWDKRYFAGHDYFRQCLTEIHEGKRVKLAYL